MNIDRHCATCLEIVEASRVRLCKTCKRRAYCSKNCRHLDRRTSGKGQGHKQWCKLRCGEEDIDWKICKVSGKGLGVIAKKKIPSMFRIIVEKGHNEDEEHPAINDLMPIGGTFYDKYNLNKFGSDGEDNGLYLRISRVNHSCKPNAAYMYDETFKVLILYSLTDIKIGQEITINYQQFDDVRCKTTPEDSRALLQQKWHITCPLDCFCYDKETAELMEQNRKNDKNLPTLSWKKALELIRELIRNYEKLGSPLCNYAQTFSDGYLLAKSKNDLGTAKCLIEALYTINFFILSPESEEVKRIAQLMNDIEV
ncbi:SET domain-containing protein 5 [Pseudolycoriella hygida]|uniref:SET domain-containing protein 5 n=1 Tax=Pseudolycoriella hygida TaxID=35572 RepID=A0A9Q0N9M1_9DIPT|nr:SET domain-containing protein 5 [Pseudolycoriella hygida]